VLTGSQALRAETPNGAMKMTKIVQAQLWN
jgi:hypothetical protein